jgi:hypothetical protein
MARERRGRPSHGASRSSRERERDRRGLQGITLGDKVVHGTTPETATVHRSSGEGVETSRLASLVAFDGIVLDHLRGGLSREGSGTWSPVAVPVGGLDFLLAVGT